MKNFTCCDVSPRIDIKGKKFGRLTVLEPVGKQSREIVYNCVCDCGKRKKVIGASLRGGIIQSCGCLLFDSKPGLTHGKWGSRVWSIWSKILDRCYNPKHIYYSNYGGRGISVCKKWWGFEGFYADMGDPPKGYQIDRIDNDDNYHVENCQWVTPKQNTRNRNNNKLIWYNGEIKCLAEWCEIFKMNRGTVMHRLRSEWSLDDVFNKPVRFRSDFHA